MPTLVTLELLCAWFANCTNPFAGAVFHPVLGYLPVCTRCATTLDLDLLPAEIV